jgi:hypothetical protein
MEINAYADKNCMMVDVVYGSRKSLGAEIVSEYHEVNLMKEIKSFDSTCYTDHSTKII